MKVWVTTRMALSVVLSLFALTAASASAAPALLNGDIVLLSMPCYECRLIEKTTGSDYSHAGIIRIDETGRARVVMAVAPRVVEVDLEWLSGQARLPPKFLRAKTLEGRRLAYRAAIEAQAFIGRRYDRDFVWGEDSLYCFELVGFAFLRANAGVEIFPARPMDFRPFEREWHHVLGHAPPQGELGLSARDFEDSPWLEELDCSLSFSQ